MKVSTEKNALNFSLRIQFDVNKMDTDFFALFEELLQHAKLAQQAATDAGIWFGTEDRGLFARVQKALDRAIAALKTAPAPVVEFPSDPVAELDTVQELLNNLGTEWNADAGFYLLSEHGVAELIRTALARYGATPAPAPVPVSERPWKREGWCDNKARCWWFNDEACAWVLIYASAESPPSTIPADSLMLPAHALPLPEVAP